MSIKLAVSTIGWMAVSFFFTIMIMSRIDQSVLKRVIEDVQMIEDCKSHGGPFSYDYTSFTCADGVTIEFKEGE